MYFNGVKVFNIVKGKVAGRSITIVTNGTYDLTDYTSANVQIATDYDSSGYALSANRYGNKAIFLVNYSLTANEYGSTAQLV